MNKVEVMKLIALLASKNQNVTSPFDLERFNSMVKELAKDKFINEELTDKSLKIYFSGSVEISCELREHSMDPVICFTVRTDLRPHMGRFDNDSEEVRELYQKLRKKILMKRIKTVSWSSYPEIEKLDKIVEEFDGPISVDLTEDGFKVWFEKDGVEIYCALKETHRSIFYSIKVDHMSVHSGLCGMEDKARELYDMTLNSLLGQ